MRPKERRKIEITHAARPSSATAALLLALVQAVDASENSHAPCDCGASAVADDSVAYKTCRSTGDPHYSGWDNKRFNFYGFGAYRLAKAPITRCGCDLDVQTFTGPNLGVGSKAAAAAAGASSNVAVAARFGAVVMTIRGDDRSIHLHDASTGTDVRSGFDEWGENDQQDVLEAQYGIGRVGHRPDADGSERGFRGWKVAVPGGGARRPPARHSLRALPPCPTHPAPPLVSSPQASSSQGSPIKASSASG